MKVPCQLQIGKSMEILEWRIGELWVRDLRRVHIHTVHLSKQSFDPGESISVVYRSVVIPRDLQASPGGWPPYLKSFFLNVFGLSCRKLHGIIIFEEESPPQYFCWWFNSPYVQASFILCWHDLDAKTLLNGAQKGRSLLWLFGYEPPLIL